MAGLFKKNGRARRIPEKLAQYDDEYLLYCVEKDRVETVLESTLHETDDPKEIIDVTLKTVCEFYGGDWAGVMDIDMDTCLWRPVCWFRAGGATDRTLYRLSGLEDAEVMPRWLECSTIDNRAMKVFLEKMRPDTFLVLAGDTYQIESIDFGNWFTYAKDIIKTKGSNVELVSTWRTKDPGLIELWNETRNKGALITEKLVIDGPFSENIGEGVLNSEIMDEVILCLNYDGKFGLNNMNSYFQNANTEKAVVWRDWKYKVGDHILFNDTDRFSLLYNNLKGRIVQIELFDRRIRFTVDVEIPLTEQDCQNDGIEFIDIIDDVTRIRFDVLDFEEEMTDEDRKKTVVPFQLAYAVSIHKAQGLEYRSVKVVIPSSNAEKITHGIFYTAITRAKEKLKIYWSSETMQEVVAGFSVDTSRQKSLAIIKEKLKQDKNT